MKRSPSISVSRKAAAITASVVLAAATVAVVHHERIADDHHNKVVHFRGMTTRSRRLQEATSDSNPELQLPGSNLQEVINHNNDNNYDNSNGPFKFLNYYLKLLYEPEGEEIDEDAANYNYDDEDDDDKTKELSSALPSKSTQEMREKFFGIISPPSESMPLHLRNTMESVDPSDVVFFWHMPVPAAHLMKVITGRCYGLRRAQKLQDPPSMEFIKDTVLNIDTQTPKGIAEAQSLNLVDSGKVDIITSSYVISASSLFTSSHMGRAFTILEHPIVTAVGKFAERKKKRMQLNKMTLAEYATTDVYPDNWMVRQLTETLPGVELTADHLQHAKNLLMSKFFVGIADQMEETVRQVQLYYGWKPVRMKGKKKRKESDYSCALDMVRGVWPGMDMEKKNLVIPERASEDWNVVAERERWDMELYYIGLEMFSKQNRLLNGADN